MLSGAPPCIKKKLSPATPKSNKRYDEVAEVAVPDIKVVDPTIANSIKSGDIALAPLVKVRPQSMISPVASSPIVPSVSINPIAVPPMTVRLTL